MKNGHPIKFHQLERGSFKEKQILQHFLTTNEFFIIKKYYLIIRIQ